MAILNNTKTDKIWVPEHVLMIGKTKAGKSRWAVEAVKDGYETIYVDADNGLQAIRDNVVDMPEVMSRLHYFHPQNMAAFAISLFTESVYRYNETRRADYNRTSDSRDDVIAEFRPALIPPRVLLVLDSWTSLTFSIIKAQADKLKVDLLDIDKYSREIYGGAGYKATQICGIIQNLKFGCIVIAHAADYERKEKPLGTVGNIQEKEMVIKEVVQVPASTSLPHGHSIGKFFTQIGNMYVKPRMNDRILSFKIEADKISGGSPNAEGDPMKEYRYSKLFGFPPAKADNEPRWIRYITVGELQDEIKAAAGTPVTPQPKVIVPPTTGASPNIAPGAVTPVAQKDLMAGMAALMKK